ncbi:hypothetical protein M9H77_26417 [Catharanthus roseus]|uniref:Uncharacterized protein n=1 Tax=Catharanthus roseus TaxID=4058 RepID=A0ACC0A9Y2_CATRO|nr:hypothetical protein M9H77_26417 [Catharanthus roseus]
MVQLGARSDDGLGVVTDRTGRVERRAVTASSRGVRGRHSTSDIPSTPAPIAPGMYYDPGALGSSTQPTLIPFTTHPPPTTSYHPYTPVLYDPYGYSQPPQTSYDPYAHAPSLPIRMPGLDPTQHFSRTQIPLNDFFKQLAGSVPVDSSYSSAEYGATARGISSSDVGKIAGSRQKRPEKSGPSTNPTQRKKSKNDGWEQTGPADGSPQDPVIVPSNSGHIAGCIWRGQNRGILTSRSHYVSLTGWTPSDLTVVYLAGETRLSNLRSCMFQHPNSSLLSSFVERWQPDTNSFDMP